MINSRIVFLMGFLFVASFQSGLAGGRLEKGESVCGVLIESMARHSFQTEFECLRLLEDDATFTATMKDFERRFPSSSEARSAFVSLTDNPSLYRNWSVARERVLLEAALAYAESSERGSGICFRDGLPMRSYYGADAVAYWKSLRKILDKRKVSGPLVESLLTYTGKRLEMAAALRNSILELGKRRDGNDLIVLWRRPVGDNASEGGGSGGNAGMKNVSIRLDDSVLKAFSDMFKGGGAPSYSEEARETAVGCFVGFATPLAECLNHYRRREIELGSKSPFQELLKYFEMRQPGYRFLWYFVYREDYPGEIWSSRGVFENGLVLAASISGDAKRPELLIDLPFFPAASNDSATGGKLSAPPYRVVRLWYDGKGRLCNFLVASYPRTPEMDAVVRKMADSAGIGFKIMEKGALSRVKKLLREGVHPWVAKFMRPDTSPVVRVVFLPVESGGTPLERLDDAYRSAAKEKKALYDFLSEEDKKHEEALSRMSEEECARARTKDFIEYCDIFIPGIGILLMYGYEKIGERLKRKKDEELRALIDGIEREISNKRLRRYASRLRRIKKMAEKELEKRKK